MIDNLLYRSKPIPHNVLLPLLLSIILVVVSFLWQGYVGFSLWDEGFLWYGATRVMQGEVPIRDFMAYDPGRYYWSAMLMSLSDDNGIMTLRWSVAVFQVAGLFIGLKLISDSVKKQNFLYLLLSAVILLVWMFPRHKLFDISLSIFLVGILTFLITNPTSKRFFYAGIGVGLIAVFGRNHGAYGVVGALCAMTWLSIGLDDKLSTAKRFSYFFLGCTVGFLPVIFMLLLVPGFDLAFIDSIRFLLDAKSTNLSLPVPWPWLVNFSDIPVGHVVRNVLVGLLFMVLMIFPMFGIIWISWQKYHGNKVNSVFVAAAFLSLPYAHFAYSRADISHLAQAIFPLLIGALVMFFTSSTKIKWSGVILLTLISIWTMHHYHPGWQCYARTKCEGIEISGSNILADRRTAAEVKMLRDLEKQYAVSGKSFVIFPYWPGAYSLLQSKSPVWEIFALFPRQPSFEKAEIERIKLASPGFLLVYDKALNGREVLRFKNTHPLTYKYINEHYKRLPESLGPAYQVYVPTTSI